MDVAFVNHGEGANCTAVVAVSGWAADLLQTFFFDNGDNNGDNGDNGEGDGGGGGTSWTLQLERLYEGETGQVLLVHADRLDALGLSTGLRLHNKTHGRNLTMFHMFDYWRRNDRWKDLTAELVERRRRHVLGPLFRHVSGRTLVVYRALQEHLLLTQGAPVSTTSTTTSTTHLHVASTSNSNSSSLVDPPVKYIAIHSRWLEGSCEWRVGGGNESDDGDNGNGSRLIQRDDCWIPPDYVRDVLEHGPDSAAHGKEDRRKMPIVLIEDGQNPTVYERLRKDPDLGPRLIRARDLPRGGADAAAAVDAAGDETNASSSFLGWLKKIDRTRRPGKQRPQPANDMMVAIGSEIFIGTRASSMAVMIGQIRVVLRDVDPLSNYIYDRRRIRQPQQDGNGGNSSSNNNNNNATPNDVTIEVCGECVFLCNATTGPDNICGFRFLLP